MRVVAVPGGAAAGVSLFRLIPAQADPATDRARPESAGSRAPARPHTTGSIERPLDPADPLGPAPSRWATSSTRRAAAPSEGTVLAIEGGPGYATTSSRDYYLDLVGPLAQTHDLLLVDARGTGRSDAHQLPAAAVLPRQLPCGRSPAAADSSARRVTSTAVRSPPTTWRPCSTTSAIARVDVYGDSYGTFLGQTFTVRHPDRVRTLTLDAAYPVAGP